MHGNTPRSSWHEFPTPPACTLKPPRPPDGRRPMSPTSRATSPHPTSPPPRRPTSIVTRVRRKSQALLGPINSLPIPPSPPPCSTKAFTEVALEDDNLIMPVVLQSTNPENTMKQVHNGTQVDETPSPSPSEDDEDEEIKSLLSSPTSPTSSPNSSRPSSPSPVPSPKSPVAGTPSTPSGFLRPITPAPKRGATYRDGFPGGLVSLQRPSSLPAFTVPEKREDKGKDSSLPPLLKARVEGNARRSMSPPSRRPSSPPSPRARPASTPAISSNRLTVEYRNFDHPLAGTQAQAPVRDVQPRRIPQPRVKPEPKLEVILNASRQAAWEWVGVEMHIFFRSRLSLLPSVCALATQTFTHCAKQSVYTCLSY